jgi:hypothetical protein
MATAGYEDAAHKRVQGVAITMSGFSALGLMQIIIQKQKIKYTTSHLSMQSIYQAQRTFLLSSKCSFFKKNQTTQGGARYNPAEHTW